MNQSFESHLSNLKETNMVEELSCRIGDLVTDRSVDLEVLPTQSVERLKHLYRFMVENPQLELCSVDDLIISLRFRTCGHEYPLAWMSLVDDVAGLIEDGAIQVKCKHCHVSPPKEDEKMEQRYQQEKPQEQSTALTKNDMEKAALLCFQFVKPLDELNLKPSVQKQAERLASRIEVRLNAYKQACASGNATQAKNAGLALKNGLNFMRKKLGVGCQVKMSS